MNRNIIIGVAVGIVVDLIITAIFPGGSILEAILGLLGGIGAGISVMRRFRSVAMV